ncbi:hypothetical protein QUF90_08850 [Desulfococcaceae bacterium HSG9]|nr:hypothetical protein [Desulfococcaceae bacterium HSG9]
MVQIVAMDDSNFQRKMLTKIVKEEGHEVIEAANGHEGLFKIATYRPGPCLDGPCHAQCHRY